MVKVKVVLVSIYFVNARLGEAISCNFVRVDSSTASYISVKLFDPTSLLFAMQK